MKRKSKQESTSTGEERECQEREKKRESEKERGEYGEGGLEWRHRLIEAVAVRGIDYT